LHLEAVAFAQRPESRFVGHAVDDDSSEFLEEQLEARRRDDLEDPCRSVDRVPERVPLAAWLVDEVADLGSAGGLP
jgi:hypothetical protein